MLENLDKYLIFSDLTIYTQQSQSLDMGIYERE